MARSSRHLLAAGLLGVALLVGGCGAGAPARGGLTVVAGESFWGSLAAQLAGSRANVSSIIVNPDTDPHSYEATAADAREVAGARMVIVNGIGYDTWLSQLIAADQTRGQLQLNVGNVLHLHTGDNPHQWYSPAQRRDRDRADHARPRAAGSARRGVLPRP